MLFVISGRRLPRPIIALLALILLVLAATILQPFIRPHYVVPLRTPTSVVSRIPSTIINARVSLHDILDQLESIISASASDYINDKQAQELGFRLGSLSLQGYAADLTSIYNDFFSDASPVIDLLPRVLSHLSLLPPPSEALPKYIYSTGLEIPSDLGYQFHSWAQVNPDWQNVYVSDATMDEWLNETFVRDGALMKELDALGHDHGIIRADLFR